MKRILFSMMLTVIVCIAASAQTTQPKTGEVKAKAKPTSTIPQKVNNVIRPKHKHYSGYKVKHKVSK